MGSEWAPGCRASARSANPPQLGSMCAATHGEIESCVHSVNSAEVTTFDGLDDDVSSRHIGAYVAIVGRSEGAVVRLQRGTPLTVGRSHSSGVRIRDKAASRLHATLYWDGGSTVRLEDAESRNGTFVGGKRVRGTIEIASGTEITIGKVTLVVVVEECDRVAIQGAPVVEPSLIAVAPAMRDVVRTAERAARSDITVLVTGETGVGKELVARHLHMRSPRRGGPFLAVNCGSIAESLAESALFGHEKGAFTGATAQHRGVFERAEGGTLFLDEIGELSPALQVKLLRALEQRIITPVGGSAPVRVDVRVVAATHRDLPAMVRDGAFRQDLLFRLNVLPIEIPPLRARREDLEPLITHLLGDLAPGRKVRVSDEAIARLHAHSWPGNVRELRNVLERALALYGGGVVQLEDLDLGTSAPEEGPLRSKVDEAERDTIADALRACSGNQTQAARRLGISRRTLIYKMERHGLKPPPKPRR